MNSDSFMVLFDFIVFFYGVYMIYSGYVMRRTGQPSSLIINQTELIGARDPKKFCEVMFKPLVLFGIMAMIYGVAGYINDKYFEIPMVNFGSVALFLILCVWFLRETKKNKAKYIR